MTKTPPFADPGSIEGAIEETTAFAPKFNKDGLIPAVATDAKTGELLMLAYMNAEALAKTIETGQAWYYSRSRARLWRKGESSGHTQTLRSLRTDCDQDTIQLIVDQAGPACHTQRQSCFYRRVEKDGDALELVFEEGQE